MSEHHIFGLHSRSRGVAAILAVFAILQPSTVSPSDVEPRFTCDERDRKVANMFAVASDMNKTADQMEAELDAWFSDANIAVLLGRVRVGKGAVDTTCGAVGLAANAGAVGAACTAWKTGTSIGSGINAIKDMVVNSDVSKAAMLACKKSPAKAGCNLGEAYKSQRDGDGSGAMLKTVEGTSEAFAAADVSPVGKRLGKGVAGIAGGANEIRKGMNEVDQVKRENEALNANTIRPQAHDIRQRAADLRLIAMELRRQPCGPKEDKERDELLKKLVELARKKGEENTQHISPLTNSSKLAQDTADANLRLRGSINDAARSFGSQSSQAIVNPYGATGFAGLSNPGMSLPSSSSAGSTSSCAPQMQSLANSIPQSQSMCTTARSTIQMAARMRSLAAQCPAGEREQVLAQADEFERWGRETARQICAGG